MKHLQFVCLVALIALAGCGAEPSTDQDSAAVPLTLDTPLMPTLIVTNDELPAESERTLRRRMQSLAVPGVSVAVFRDYEVVWAEGFGWADVAADRPVTTETLFQAASISKPVAAMATLRLVEDGVLELDGDVNQRLVSWQVPGNEFTDPLDEPRRPVTLRNLLSHTAGMTVSGFPGYNRSEEMPSTIEVLDGAGNTAPIRVDIPPGTTRRYSGGGYTVTQLLMSDVTGKDFAELMAEMVLEPVGMVHSTFEQPLPEALHDRAATAHEADGTPVDGSWHVYPEQAAAGMWTTPTDLARFAIAVQRGLAGDGAPVLSADMTREMVTAPVEEGYGLGLSLGEARFGHGGGNRGFKCSLTAFYEGGNGAVVMTNSDGGWMLGAEVMAHLFGHYGWPGLEPSEKTAVEMTPEQLGPFAGTYRMESWGDIVMRVADEGDRLFLEYPDGDSGVLRPESATVFFDPADFVTVDFLLDEATGAVTGFDWQGNVIPKIDPADPGTPSE
jgi:CubicO group peptidase (beta-lactamase class C family)